jgi:hypothetical protein
MKIYVVGSSKNKFLPLDNIREKFLIDQPHEGDNIDFLNQWYCELTGLYYLWKHVDDDIVGLEHYRRYFVNEKNKPLSETEIHTALNDCDILCIKANYTKRRPPKTWLIRNGKWFDMQKFLTFIKVYIGQEYYETCINHLDGNWHALGNMFITRKELIDKYCEFIYDLTFAYMQAEKSYGRQLPGRIIGYFTEFLFGAWLKYNNKKIKFKKVRIVR